MDLILTETPYSEVRILGLLAHVYYKEEHVYSRRIKFWTVVFEDHPTFKASVRSSYDDPIRHSMLFTERGHSVTQDVLGSEFPMFADNLTLGQCEKYLETAAKFVGKEYAR